jgi:hypothetical protein
MNDPRCRRFHRIYEDFSICVNIGEKGYVLAEHPNERYTIFYYPIYGKGRFGKLFDENYLMLEEGNIYDVNEYLHSNVAFQAEEDFHLIGFNTNDKNVKWKSEIINTDNNHKFSVDHSKSYLLCLNGKISINNKIFKRYDYAQLNVDKEYIIDHQEGSTVAIFTKIM